MQRSSGPLRWDDFQSGFITLYNVCAVRWGAQYRGGVLYCGGYHEYRVGYYDKCGRYLEYRGGGQYRGGYHEYRGVILSTVGGVQYHGGYMMHVGGYHEYHGGCSVLQSSACLLLVSTPTCFKIE